ncbi:MAG: WecB/TagA/CpsF family glycosyltransferase [Ilumatobacteraceae bacterium]
MLLRDGIADRLPTGRRALVVTPNVDHIVHLAHDGDAVVDRLVDSAAWVVPDGQPVVWASRLLGTPLAARIAGSTVVSELWPRLLAAGRRVLVVAANERTASLVAADTGDTASSIVAPFIDPNDRPAFEAFVERCVSAILDTGAEYVFVAIGFPRREHLIAALFDRLPADGRCPIVLAVGASFEMHYGFVRRAPQWVQRIGMEWLYRFVQEPRRLFRRYFVDDTRFASVVWREWRRRRHDGDVRRWPV